MLTIASSAGPSPLSKRDVSTSTRPASVQRGLALVPVAIVGGTVLVCSVLFALFPILGEDIVVGGIVLWLRALVPFPPGFIPEQIGLVVVIVYWTLFAIVISHVTRHTQWPKALAITFVALLLVGSGVSAAFVGMGFSYGSWYGA